MKTKNKQREQSYEDERTVLEIDENALDTEWKNQPELYFQYARRLADARMDLEEAKADLDVTTAELDKCIRDEPEKYGLTKIVEAAVSNCIAMQEEHQKARAMVSRSKHNVDILAAYIEALDHRKKALENLVSLRLANYYSEPKARTEAAEDYINEKERREVRKPKRRE